MKRTIEIDDTRQETVEAMNDDLLNRAIDYIAEDQNIIDCLYSELDYDGSVHSIIDSSCPIYSSDIDTWFYLYSNDLESAYDNAGCYSEKPDNYKQVCCFFYLQEKATEYLETLQKEIEPVIGYIDITCRTIDPDVVKAMITKYRQAA